MRIKSAGFVEKLIYGDPGEHPSFVFSRALSVYFMKICSS